MAFPYRIDSSRRLATVILSGTVHGYEITETIESLYRDPIWTSGFDILWDATNIAELLFEQTDIPNFVRLQVQYVAVAPRREVILVKRDLDEMMAKIYAVQVKSAGHQAYVCRSETEANNLIAQVGA